MPQGMSLHLFILILYQNNIQWSSQIPFLPFPKRVTLVLSYIHLLTCSILILSLVQMHSHCPLLKYLESFGQGWGTDCILWWTTLPSIIFPPGPLASFLLTLSCLLILKRRSCDGEVMHGIEDCKYCCLNLEITSRSFGRECRTWDISSLLGVIFLSFKGQRNPPPRGRYGFRFLLAIYLRGYSPWWPWLVVRVGQGAILTDGNVV